MWAVRLVGCYLNGLVMRRRDESGLGHRAVMLSQEGMSGGLGLDWERRCTNYQYWTLSTSIRQAVPGARGYSVRAYLLTCDAQRQGPANQNVSLVITLSPGAGLCPVSERLTWVPYWCHYVSAE